MSSNSTKFLSTIISSKLDSLKYIKSKAVSLVCIDEYFKDLFQGIALLEEVFSWIERRGMVSEIALRKIIMDIESQKEIKSLSLFYKIFEKHTNQDLNDILREYVHSQEMNTLYIQRGEEYFNQWKKGKKLNAQYQYNTCMECKKGLLVLNFDTGQINCDHCKFTTAYNPISAMDSTGTFNTKTMSSSKKNQSNLPVSDLVYDRKTGSYISSSTGQTLEGPYVGVGGREIKQKVYYVNTSKRFEKLQSIAEQQGMDPEFLNKKQKLDEFINNIIQIGKYRNWNLSGTVLENLKRIFLSFLEYNQRGLKKDSFKYIQILCIWLKTGNSINELEVLMGINKSKVNYTVVIGIFKEFLEHEKNYVSDSERRLFYETFIKPSYDLDLIINEINKYQEKLGKSQISVRRIMNAKALPINVNTDNKKLIDLLYQVLKPVVNKKHIKEIIEKLYSTR